MFKGLATVDSRMNPEVRDIESTSSITAIKKYKAIVLLDIPVLEAIGESSLEELTSMEAGMYVNSTTSKDYIVDYLKKAANCIDTAYNGMTINDMRLKVFLQAEALKRCKASQYDIIFTRKKDWTPEETGKIDRFINFSVSKSKYSFGMSIISSDERFSLYRLIQESYKGVEKHRGFMVDTNCCKKTFSYKDMGLNYKELKMYYGKMPLIEKDKFLLNADIFFKYKLEKMLYSSLLNKRVTTSKAKLAVFNTAIPYGIWDKNSLKKYGVDVSGLSYDNIFSESDAELEKEREYVILPTEKDLESFVIFSKDINSIYAAEAFSLLINSENSEKFYESKVLDEVTINYNCFIQDKLSDISTKMDIQGYLDSVMLNGNLIRANLSDLVFYSNIIFLLDVSFRRIFEGESANGENLGMTVSNIIEAAKETLKNEGIISSNTTFEYALTEDGAGKYKLKIKIKDEDNSREFEYSIDISNS